jgi:PadR family transcriptional regulator PadR
MYADLMRKTRPLIQVAMTLLDDPTGRHWGYELSRKADVRSGVLYPMLTRFLDEGLLQDGWEDPATISGRPPRRYYELTDKGLTVLGGILQEARRDARFVGLAWRFA